MIFGVRAEIKRRFRLSRCLTISNKDRIKQLVETICAERIDITVNYGDWFAIGCILAGMFEEEEKIVSCNRTILSGL